MNLGVQPHTLYGDYAGSRPILVVATSDSALRRASNAVEASGHRCVPVAFDEAASRIQIQPAASGIWVEVDEDGGAPLDRLIDQCRRLLQQRFQQIRIRLL